MAGMKEIRGHIESIKSTQKVTNAMYLIASTKMRRAKEDLEKTRPFFDALTGEIERIFQRGGEIRSPYVFCGDADDSDQSGTQTNDNGFCIKYLRYISLRCPDRAQDSNLLLPFQYTDVGDNPDHN